jgi:riboflavin kinase/FMN adenylyltransferase
MPQVFPSLTSAGKEGSFDHLAIGFFDGLHLGHRAVICGNRNPEQLRKVCVFTFEPHPIAVLNPEGKPPLITGLPHKLKILETWQIGSVLTFPFDLGRSRQDPLDFLSELSQALPFIRSISVGTRWRFGHQRRGDIEMLSAFCKSREIDIQISEPIAHRSEIISSSRLRTAIQSGNLPEAAEMLGRPFQLFGPVIAGRQLGRTLQVPTANLQTDDECFPPSGVYAGYAVLPDGRRIPSAINLGHRPTVDNAPALQIEAHLLDFNEDLYGQNIFLEPVQFLRSEQKFSSLEDLKTALGKDIASTRSILL